MVEIVVFAVALVGLALMLLKARVPASVLFFSLLVGQIFKHEISGEVYNIVNSVFGRQDFTLVQLGLLLTPFVLTILFMQRKAPRGKFFIEAIPMLLTMSALAIFLYPLVPAIQSVLEDITNHRVETYKNITIAVATTTHLFNSWYSYTSKARAHNKKKQAHKDFD